MVTLTGFEPVISAVRGQRPRPLDDKAIKFTVSLISSRNYFGT